MCDGHKLHNTSEGVYNMSQNHRNSKSAIKIELEVDRQMAMIQKGVAQLIGEETLRMKVRNFVEQKIPLRIKLGLDPSAPDLHLGHAVVLRKARQFQDLGHHVIIVLGDFTGRIGDPTGKSKGRPVLSKESVLENAQTYALQLHQILDKDKTEIRFNSEWLSSMNFEQVLLLAQSTTLARMLERDDFTNRFNRQTPIGLHEFFYPLMQAQDSVAIRADVELGGTDQTFNILMGRTLQKSLGLDPQTAIFMPLLEGIDGKEKMSKSLNNAIGINESIHIQFKKIMEIPDTLIFKFFDLATDLSPDQITVIHKNLALGENPRNIKMLLAKAILSLYHSQESVESAKVHFEQVHSQKLLPDDLIPLWLPLNVSELGILELVFQLKNMKVIESSSHWRRLIQQSGVKVNNEIATLDQVLVSGDVLQIGKRHFFQIFSGEIGNQ